MSKGAGTWDPDYSHSVRDSGIEPDDGYSMFGHGDPEGDLARGSAPRWTAHAGTVFRDRRKAKDDVQG